MLNVELELLGADTMVSMLDAIFGRTQNFRPLLEGDLTDETRKFFVEQFASGGAAGGEPWAPLAASTLAIRASQGFGPTPILRRTDTLYNSLTQRDAPYALREVDGDSLQFGTTDPAAGELQEGLGRMPARQIIPDEIPAQYADGWDALVLDYVEGD